MASNDVRRMAGAMPTGQRGQQNVGGYVSYEKPTPGSLSDPVYVVVPSHSSQISFAYAWPNLHGGALPAAGDVFLMGYDERDQLWVQVWYPAAGEFAPVVAPS